MLWLAVRWWRPRRTTEKISFEVRVEVHGAAAHGSSARSPASAGLVSREMRFDPSRAHLGDDVLVEERVADLDDAERRRRAAAAGDRLSNIPISVNGLGLREQLHAILLAPLGVPREAAVAISLLIFAHLLVSSLIGLLFWFRLPADVKSQIPNPESQIPSEL